MEHIAALLLIVGCSDDLTQCRELPVPTALYEAEEDCAADLEPAISSYATKQPQVFGQCVSVDPAAEEEDAELVWRVKADGTLFAAIEIPDVMVASTSARREDLSQSAE